MDILINDIDIPLLREQRNTLNKLLDKKSLVKWEYERTHLEELVDLLDKILKVKT